MNSNFKDLAILLTWPDATIRGDEKWMMFFKKIGIVKNLNFKVGHTGIIIVNHIDGTLLFYDFGRYITPRGYGRARSPLSDPLLKIDIKAEIKNKNILNIEEIIIYLESIKSVLYGEGRLYFSIVHDIDFEAAKKYGDDCVLQGTYPYGAIAKKNNNCSRFITRMLMKSSLKFNFWHSINFPETIKSSPVSNLINAVDDRKIYSYTPDEGIIKFKMNRLDSLLFLIKQLGDNIFKHKAELLPTDKIIGAMTYHSKPSCIPTNTIYLGGIGDGAWYHYKILDNNLLHIQRFTINGKLEYTVLGLAPTSLNLTEDFEITYDSHLLFTTIIQNKQKFHISHIEQVENDTIE